MKITILNMPAHNTVQYFESLLAGLNQHKRFENAHIKLISEKITQDHNSSIFLALDALPIEKIPALPSSPHTMEHYVEGSDIVFVMCNTADNDPDGYTFDILNRLSELKNKPQMIVAECELDSERSRLIKEGADAVIRPTRTYPSIFIRSIASKGSEEILEKIIDLDSEYKKLVLNEKNIVWKDIFFKNYDENGMAVGYIDLDGVPHINPKMDKSCDIQSILFFKHN
jgi:hypothetical protein